MKIIKNDEVKIMRGKDKGKTGKVEAVFANIGKILIPGVNEYKKHKKGNVQGQKSEIITITKPIPVGNVMFLCPKCHETSRIGYAIQKNKKVRVCKKCGNTL